MNWGETPLCSSAPAPLLSGVEGPPGLVRPCVGGVHIPHPQPPRLVSDCSGWGSFPGRTQLLQRGPELREEAVWHHPGRAQAAPEVGTRSRVGRPAAPASLPCEQRFCLAQGKGGDRKPSLASRGLTAPPPHQAAGTLPEVQGQLPVPEFPPLLLRCPGCSGRGPRSEWS